MKVLDKFWYFFKGYFQIEHYYSTFQLQWLCEKTSISKIYVRLMCQEAWGITDGKPAPLCLFIAWWYSSKLNFYISVSCHQKGLMGWHTLAGIAKILFFCLIWVARSIHSVSCCDVKLLFSKVPEAAECAGPIFGRELKNSASLSQFPYLASLRAE